MNEQMVISIVGGLILGAVAAGAGGLLLRHFGRTMTGGMDIDLYYAELDELKRVRDAEDEKQGRNLSDSLRTLLLKYGLAVGVLMIVVLRGVLALPVDLSLAVVMVVALWLSIAGIPLTLLISFKLNQIVILEIASVLERIVHSTDEAEEWIIRASKAVFGGDLFGEDQEDTIELRLSRTEIAPVVLSIAGHVQIAENGLERTVSKGALRQLRLKGWFVDELSSVEAEFKHEWSLHDSTYADIADDISHILDSLGFSVRNVRIRRVNPYREEETVLLA